MQRIVSQAPRLGARPILSAINGAGTGSASSHRTQGTVEGIPGIFASDDEDWSFVRDPVTPSEVDDALSDLTVAMGHSTLQIQPRSEGGWSSSASSDTSANDLIASAEHSRDRLCNIVSNVLNDADAGPAICNVLSRDPEFRSILGEYRATTTTIQGLPAPAQILMLPGPDGWRPTTRNDNPLDSLLQLVVKALCNLGNALRRLPNDIAILLSGLSGQRAQDVRGRSPAAQADYDKQWEMAFKRVITAVAVALITRRAVVRGI